ncbi:hypothetical protein IJ732_01120, partial [bacterium]|nr:hypothetical protein [bacterium]
GTTDGGLDCGKYILTYHKLFDGLINNCTAYDNGECSQCENGYQNNGTSCRDIRENTCDTYSGTTCTKCTSSNLLADGECIDSKTLNCDETNGVSCTKCSQDYKLSGSSCVEMATLAEKTTARIATCKENGSSTCTWSDNRTMFKLPDNTYGLHNWDSNNTTMTYQDAKDYCESAGLSLPSSDDVSNFCGGSFFSSGYAGATSVWLLDYKGTNSYSCSQDLHATTDKQHVICVSH